MFIGLGLAFAAGIIVGHMGTYIYMIIKGIRF